MEELPSELQVAILQKCDFMDCICFRATSKTNYDFGKYVLGKMRSFDSRDYHAQQILDAEKRTKNGQTLKPCKMIHFMGHLTSLRKLVLADLSCLFTMSDMIRLGKCAPCIQKLVIIQSENYTWLGKEALMGLGYFESLEKLKLIGWEASFVVDRGCAYRCEVLPPITLHKLTNLTIICKHQTVSQILKHIVDYQIVMEKCVKIKFNVQLSSENIPRLIMRFIEMHPNIQKIAFNGFLFTTQEQVQSFYDHLLALPKLERLHMENCSVIEKIEQALQKAFSDALRKRGITFSNLVKSLRHV